MFIYSEVSAVSPMFMDTGEKWEWIYALSFLVTSRTCDSMVLYNGKKALSLLNSIAQGLPSQSSG